jgi:hypothetical protein
MKADYGDKGQKAANEADRARAGARQAAVAGVRVPKCPCACSVAAFCPIQNMNLHSIIPTTSTDF